MSAPEDRAAVYSKSAPSDHHHRHVVHRSSSSSAAGAAARGGPIRGAATILAGPSGSHASGTSASYRGGSPVAGPSGISTGRRGGGGYSTNPSNNSYSESYHHHHRGGEKPAATHSVGRVSGSSAAGNVPSGAAQSGRGKLDGCFPASAPVDSSAAAAVGSYDTKSTSSSSFPSPRSSSSLHDAGGLGTDGRAASAYSAPSSATIVGTSGALKATTLDGAAVTQSISACSSSSSSLESVASQPNSGQGGNAGASPSQSSGRVGDKQHTLEQHCRRLEEELQSVKESEAKLKQQYIECQRRERWLARRLAVKETEMQDYTNQIAELKAAQAPGPAALRSALLDPAINILFQKLKAELQATKAKLEETQNELSAWKFTPDSNTGKRLMAKCRLLYQENEELGKMTSNGRLAKLENELALQKSYNEEVKKSQLELDDFLQELDEDVEGMQSTILFLQQELKQTKETRDELEKEVSQLREQVSTHSSAQTAHPATPDSALTEAPAGTSKSADAQEDDGSGGSESGTHHRPDGGGGDVGMGGGITPIYLVNGDGSGTSGAAADSKPVVTESSSSNSSSSTSGVGGGGGGDVVVGEQAVVYNNRTHCGGTGANSNELRTTPPTRADHSSAPPATAVVSSSLATTDENLPALPTASSTAVNGGGGGGGNSDGAVALATDDPNAAIGDALVNELKDLTLRPPLASDGNGSRTSGDHTSVVKSGNSSANVKEPAQQQHHDSQQQQRVTSNNGGRIGGRTTVAARKRNYNDTEAGDSPAELPADGDVGSDSVGYGVASGDVHLVDGVVLADSGAVTNGKPSFGSIDIVADQQQQQQDVAEPNCSDGGNKRVTRSGKAKATVTTAGSSALSANALMTSAAKKLRRGSVTMEEEIDPLANTPSHPQQQQQQQQQPLHTQQTISSANGSN